MTKTIAELESTACRYWPQDILVAASAENPIPLLIQTQDKFLSILKCADREPTAWVSVLERSTLSANLFLKHLAVLSDIGGERLQRFSRDFSKLFPTGEFNFFWKDGPTLYSFSTKKPDWNNVSLGVDKSNLTKSLSLTPAIRDVAMLLIWGGSIVKNASIPQEIIQKCIIGQLIGNAPALDQFVKERYIHVSRITGGSLANDSGHACELSCERRLAQHLPAEFSIGGHNIKDVSQNDVNLTTFDLVVTNKKSKKACAIEISFQVTTNSVIERKASLAKDRQGLLHKAGHKVAYIIDGSGNFQRRNAVSTILNFSDCSVNFSDAGIEELANYIKAELK